jgi:hypothetical protein
MDLSRVRKSVAELSLDDLELCPVWEFALDEEGEDGQDESTVRPRVMSDKLDPAAGMFIVRARFRLADGTQMHGYLTPAAEGEADLGTLQPVIVTNAGQVLFWWGVIMPPASELSAFYRRLGRTADKIFPLQFSSDVPILGGPLHGELPGFLHLEDSRTGTTRVVT